MVITTVEYVPHMIVKEARLKTDPKIVHQFLQENADLIEKYVDAKHAPDHVRFPIRRMIAEHARETFGYSRSTSDCDIVHRIVKKYLKS